MRACMYVLYCQHRPFLSAVAFGVGDILAGLDRHPGGIFSSLWLVQPQSVALTLRAAHPHIHRPPSPKGAAVLGGYTMLIGCPKRRAGHKRLGFQMDIISAILFLKIAT